MPTFIISLPMQVRADSPEQAVEAFLEQSLRYGMRTWNFNVVEVGEDDELGERTIVNGEGVRVEQEEASDDDSQAEPTPVDSDTTDERSAPESEGSTS